MQSGIDRVSSTNDFDVIQLEGSQLCGFRLPQSARLVVSEHNIEYEILERMTANERSTLRRLFNRIECLKYRPFERRWWERADACAVPSQREVDIVLSYAPATPTLAVPNAVDPDFFSPGPHAPEPDTIVFTGLLSYRPNFDAVRHLVEEILPRVRHYRPAATVTIVGDGDPADFKFLRRPGVTVTERVPDVRPYVQRAAVCVAPLRMGSGTRLKVLEALAMGKAVVSTRLGSEGLDVRDGEHLLLADHDPDDFAAGVVEVLADPARAAALGRSGRTLVLTNYTWARAADRLEELYELAMGAAVMRSPRCDASVAAYRSTS
jgi:glycosyltransferase involved in cell wall biosynthesis